MTIFGFEGVAGCGKTTRLLEALEAHIDQYPLGDNQSVLALTFMHGSRKRLRERLSGLPKLRGRFECITIDSFAQRVVRRWRTLANSKGIVPADELDFNAQCSAAADLLEMDAVRSWIASAFPVMVLDEAQDLGLQRLRMVTALAQSMTSFVAADEFQCLDSTLRPSPAVAWIMSACSPEKLTIVHRTAVASLLGAAQDIRAGKPPTTGGDFRLHGAPSVPFAAACLANAISWNGGATIAVITPVMKGGYAHDVIARVSSQACDKAKKGPHRFFWERSDADAAKDAFTGLTCAWPAEPLALTKALEAIPQCGPVRQTIKWVQRRTRVLGQAAFESSEIESVIARNFELRSQHGAGAKQRFLAMTVHQAKNREFDGVIVLWPYAAGGDLEQKRRLLYNAITRAKRWCCVIVQNAKPPLPQPFA